MSCVSIKRALLALGGGDRWVRWRGGSVRSRVRVTFSHRYGFVAHAPWLPPEGICAPSINALRNKVERMRPRVSMLIALELDPAARAKYSVQRSLGATNLKRPAPSLAPVGGGAAQR